MTSTDKGTSDYAEIIYWLALINESGLKLNLVKPIIQRWCLTEKRPMAQLFELSPLDWSTTFGLSDKEARQALTAQRQLAKQAAAVSEWQAQGIEPIPFTDPRYPSRLAHTLSPAQQPLVLWAQGAIEQLNEPGVALLGNQEPDGATAEFIGGLMASLVAEEIGLVSGYGRGLDRAAFKAMLAAEEGRAVVMLPMGLSAFAQTTSRLAGPVEANRIVLVSPFPPETPYQDRLAEARNLLIDHLALALLIPEADDESRERGSAALARGLPVFVGLTDTAQNRALIDLGALLLTDAGEVVEMVQQAMIDATLQEEEMTAQPAEGGLPSTSPAAPAPTPPPTVTLDSDDDYALRSEDLEPIDSDEALEILSTGGQVPDILRKRLEDSEEAINNE